MGRPKGGKNRKYSFEEKLECVNLALSGEKSLGKLENETGISHSVIQNWIKNYIENGTEGLAKNNRTGNPYAALHTGKNLPAE